MVLPLLEASVVAPGWVGQDAFLAGYGAAQALPGPLFTFAAYLGAAATGPVPGGVAGRDARDGRDLPAGRAPGRRGAALLARGAHPARRASGAGRGERGRGRDPGGRPRSTRSRGARSPGRPTPWWPSSGSARSRPAAFPRSSSWPGRSWRPSPFAPSEPEPGSPGGTRPVTQRGRRRPGGNRRPAPRVTGPDRSIAGATTRGHDPRAAPTLGHQGVTAMSAPRALSMPPGRAPAWVALGLVAGLALAVVLGPALAPRAARAVDGTEPDRTISVAGTGTVTHRARTSPTSTWASSSSGPRSRTRGPQPRRRCRAWSRRSAPPASPSATSGPPRSPSSPSTTTARAARSPRITGYELRNGVVATIRDLDRLADAVDGALAAGRDHARRDQLPRRRSERRRGPGPDPGHEGGPGARPTPSRARPASRSSASPRSASSRRRPRGRSRTPARSAPTRLPRRSCRAPRRSRSSSASST